MLSFSTARDSLLLKKSHTVTNHPTDATPALPARQKEEDLTAEDAEGRGEKRRGRAETRPTDTSHDSRRINPAVVTSCDHSP